MNIFSVSKHDSVWPSCYSSFTKIVAPHSFPENKHGLVKGGGWRVSSGSGGKRGEMRMNQQMTADLTGKQ